MEFLISKILIMTFRDSSDDQTEIFVDPHFLNLVLTILSARTTSVYHR